MLSGSAFLRVFLVLVAAAVLTGLVQRYWLFDSGPAETPVASGPARRPEPKPAPAPARAAERPAEAVIKPFPKAAEASPAAQPAPPPAQSPAQSPSQPLWQAASPPPPTAQAPRPSAPAEDARPEDGNGEARAVDLVDLNTAPLTALNGLRGGGAIGRAIVQNRPYASVDQLLSKRVLSRAIYQRIRDQVTVR